jgi:DNA-binding MarR family transcriptional regulator
MPAVITERRGKRRHRPHPPAAQPRLSGVLEFMQRLWAVSHGLDAVSKRMSRQLGVTGPQRLVVRLVGRFPGISAGELAALMHTHPSTLTGVLRRLERGALLVRASDAADRRRFLLRLTARGRAVDRLRAGTVEAAVKGALAASRGAEVGAASELLGRLARRLAVSARPRPGRRAAARGTRPRR